MTQTGPDPADKDNGFLSRHVRLLFWLVATMLLGTTAALHFWKLGSVPPGFYTDECSNAYNAWCIAQTGADEYGVKYPLFFRCLDDYHDSLMVYPLVPLVKVFGLKQDVARLPSALFLILASIAFAFLVQQYCRNKWLSVFSGFCFSILPWVFVTSRTITSGFSAMLLGITLGCLLLLLAVEKQSYRYAVAAGGAWAFAMYSCHVGRPMTVLFLLCFFVAHFRVVRTLWKVGSVFVVSWVGLLIPMIVSVAHAPQILTSRFRVISILQDQPAWGEAFSRFATRYVGYFSPQFLFFRGDVDLHWHTGFGGELFRFLIPMVLVGVYCLSRFFRSEPGYRFIGLGLLVYPAAAALTENPMHGGRSIDGVIFWSLTAAIGAHFLWQKRGVGRNVLVIACCAGIVEVGLYMNDFFGPYQARHRRALYSGYTDVLEACFRAAGKDETVYISGSPLAFSKPEYVYLLFFGQIDPRVYQQHGIPKDRVCLYDGTISRPGVLLRCTMHRVDMAYQVMPQALGGDPAEMPRPVFFEPNPEPIPVGAQLLKTMPVGDLLQYEIYRVK